MPSAQNMKWILRALGSPGHVFPQADVHGAVGLCVGHPPAGHVGAVGNDVEPKLHAARRVDFHSGTLRSLQRVKRLVDSDRVDAGL